MLEQLLKKISNWFTLFINSIVSVVLVLFFSRNKAKIKYINKKDEGCLIIANGPSVKNDIELIKKKCTNNKVLCLNDFANSNLYGKIKPNYYVLLEPDYWNNKLSGSQYNQRKTLFDNIIQKTQWDIILLFPYEMKNSNVLKGSGLLNKQKIILKYFNRTPINGFRSVRHSIYKMGLGCPPPRNVLVMSIYLSLNMGYDNIYIYGSDHSWHENIYIDAHNRPCVIQEHFFDQKREYLPVYKHPPTTDHPGELFKIHELFSAWSKMFQSYWLLQEYSNYLGSNIYNLSSKTYIDAFKRSIREDLIE